MTLVTKGKRKRPVCDWCGNQNWIAIWALNPNAHICERCLPPVPKDALTLEGDA